MSWAEILTAVVGLIVVAVGIYQVRNGTRQAPRTVRDTLEGYWDVLRLVETYAPAADQLVKIGELPKEDRLDYVVDMVLSYVDTLDIDQVRGIIEGWVAQQKKSE